MTKIRSIRTFIGAKHYDLSRQFYLDWGFEESIISEKMSYFSVGLFGFYLQDYYAKKWLDNTMVFLEVENLVKYHHELQNQGLAIKYPKIRISNIVGKDWGSEFFLYDPSGVLWHVGNFSTQAEKSS